MFLQRQWNHFRNSPSSQQSLSPLYPLRAAYVHSATPHDATISACLFFHLVGLPLTSAPVTGIRLWHDMLAHADHTLIVSMVKEKTISDIALTSCTNPWAPCTGFQLSKGQKHPFITLFSQPPSSQLLSLVHSDGAGPLNIVSLTRASHFVSFIDDASGWGAVHSMKNKSEAFSEFFLHQRMTETHSGHRVKALRSDNGG